MTLQQKTLEQARQIEEMKKALYKHYYDDEEAMADLITDDDKIEELNDDIKLFH